MTIGREPEQEWHLVEAYKVSLSDREIDRQWQAKQLPSAFITEKKQKKKKKNKLYFGSAVMTKGETSLLDFLIITIFSNLLLCLTLGLIYCHWIYCLKNPYLFFLLEIEVFLSSYLFVRACLYIYIYIYCVCVCVYLVVICRNSSPQPKWKHFVLVFNWNHFEMRFLNLRINFYLFIADFLSLSW